MTHRFKLRFRKVAPLLLASLVAIPLFTPQSLDANIPPVTNPLNDDGQYSLIKTVQNQLTGLAMTSPESQAMMRQYANWYVKQRLDRNHWGTQERIDQECAHDFQKRPFCVALKGLFKGEPSTFPARAILSYLQSIHTQYEIRSWIQDGNVEQLARARGSEIQRGLRGMSSASAFSKLTSHALASRSCSHAGLKRLLGMKLEQFFPDPNAQKAAMDLYSGAAACPPNNENTLAARYRLSLLYISKQQCSQALPLLKVLSAAQSPSDYQSRAMFWQIQCLNQTVSPSSPPSKELAGKELARVLLKKYPFQFHTLLMQSFSQSKALPIPLKADSKIRFKTTNNPILNEKIKAVEALMAIQQPKYAKEILDRLGPELDQTEPQFRLYVGVLYYRLNFYLRNFQLLGTAFRDDPKLISRAAMELYFPKTPLPFSDAKKIAMDERLLLALIRQESGFNAKAKSKVGARGLMQIMPGTARRFESIRKYDQLFNPAMNLRIGSQYFAGLLEKYKGDTELALAAYNAGPKRVDQWLAAYPVKDRILFLDLIPFKETREYVAMIARNYFWYTHLYSNEANIAQNLTTREAFREKSTKSLYWWW